MGNLQFPLNPNSAWTEQHPVSRVQWVCTELVHANDYNPNTVAPPEMRLLRISIECDGFTQPIVVWAQEDGTFEVVDGFHRHPGAAHSIGGLPIAQQAHDRGRQRSIVTRFAQESVHPVVALSGTSTNA